MGKRLNSKDVIVDDVAQELTIEEEYLNEELRDQPLRLRKWTRMEARVARKVKAIGNKLELAEAEAYQRARSSSKSKLTVKDLEIAVNLDPTVVELKEELEEAEEELQELKGVVKAFVQRHEALKEMCANIRKELID